MPALTLNNLPRRATQKAVISSTSVKLIKVKSPVSSASSLPPNSFKKKVIYPGNLKYFSLQNSIYFGLCTYCIGSNIICCFLQPIGSHRGSFPWGRLCRVQSSINIWSYHAINLLVDQDPLSLGTWLSVCLVAFILGGPFALSKYWTRQQSFTGLLLFYLRENNKIELKIENTNW